MRRNSRAEPYLTKRNHTVHTIETKTSSRNATGQNTSTPTNNHNLDHDSAEESSSSGIPGGDEYVIHKVSGKESIAGLALKYRVQVRKYRSSSSLSFNYPETDPLTVS